LAFLQRKDDRIRPARSGEADLKKSRSSPAVRKKIRSGSDEGEKKLLGSGHQKKKKKGASGNLSGNGGNIRRIARQKKGKREQMTRCLEDPFRCKVAKGGERGAQAIRRGRASGKSSSPQKFRTKKRDHNFLLWEEGQKCWSQSKVWPRKEKLAKPAAYASEGGD